MKIEVTQEYKYLREYLISINDIFNSSNNYLHKARNEIKIVDINNKKIVIKSFKKPHFINRLVYTFFRPSKAERSYKNSIKIIDFVPKPIGYIIKKSNSLIKKSYFISEFFEYDFTIREVLTQKNFKNKDNIYKSFAQFTYLLHQENVLHLDYSPGNILIKEGKKGYEFKVIDLNRMTFKNLSTKDRIKNFSKLWASDEDLKIILTKYATIADLNIENTIELGVKYSQKHKNMVNLKKLIKGKKVVD